MGERDTYALKVIFNLFFRLLRNQKSRGEMHMQILWKMSYAAKLSFPAPFKTQDSILICLLSIKLYPASAF